MKKKGSDSWNVHVHLGDPEVLTDSAGKYTSYSFRFQIGTELHILKARYSVLWKFNEKVVNSYFGPNASSIPKFPPKTWLRDMTKPKNYNKRAEELHTFVKELIQTPKFLKWTTFHDLLALPPNLKKKIEEIADSMISKEEILQSSWNGKQDWPNSNSSKQNPAASKDAAKISMVDESKLEKLDKQLKEILNWAEESFMSAERGMYEHEESGDYERKDRYAKQLRGVSNVPPFRPNKDFVKRENSKPDVENFFEEIDAHLQNFEIDLFPKIANDTTQQNAPAES